MTSKTIKTVAGDLTLVPASIEQLRGVAHYWPMELLQDAASPERYGLVFQHGEEEVHGVKMQMVDVPQEDAVRNHLLHRTLIAASLPYYLEKQHRGVMVPCAYYKDKAPGFAEAGIAFFVGPDAASKPALRRGGLDYDDRLGEGATQMVLDMIGAISQAIGQYHRPPITLIGLDLRPRLKLGGLVIHFVIQGSAVIVAKHREVENDPVWEYVVRAGFSTLPYAPMIPSGLPAGPRPDFKHV